MEPSEDLSSDYAGRFLETNILDKNPFLTREDGPITKCIRIHTYIHDGQADDERDTSQSSAK